VKSQNALVNDTGDAEEFNAKAQSGKEKGYDR
jgi:hypothetical protein